MTHHHIAVSCTTTDRLPEAQQLAAELSLPLLTHSEASNADYLLLYTPDYLGLHQKGAKLPFHIDFLSGKLLYRQKHASLKKELLARAIGIHPKENPHIIDATAGLGRDSFILASLGYHLTLVERSPILHALLKDAISRASEHPALAPVMKRMKLMLADSIAWLPSQKAEIIYIDPMFPGREKSASVKKEMVILQDLLGNDQDSAKLLDAALTCATLRVVVKRPRLAERISHQEPAFNLIGKSSRFDVYLINQLKR